MTCDNLVAPAFSGRFSTSWVGGGTDATQLQHWLDPGNTVAEIGPTSTPINLINRTVTGTQNFTALNTLQLEGNVNVTPFNQFVTVCQPDSIPFTTQSGSVVEFKSQDKVVFKPGVRLLAGSSVRVRTGAIDCTTDNLIEGDWVNQICNTNAVPIACRIAGIAGNSGVNDSKYVSNSEYGSDNLEEDKENLNFSSFNYPNPFNDYTHIFYYVKEIMPVTITVYNTYYQEVTTLVNSHNHPAGKFVVTLKAGKLSPGLYFYTIQSEDGLGERYKMILTR